MSELYRSLAERALRAIEDKPPLDQLNLLREYVEQAERDTSDGIGPAVEEINILRRRYIRIGSEIYRTRPSYAR